MASNGDTATTTTTKRSGSHGGLSSCSDASRNLGNHLASRLVQLGVDTVFAVPGDYNLILLDQLIKDERLKVIYTCNELNAGYAADGYSRARGGKAACVVATFTVGGLSLLNAVAGAASESLPVICITGGPNSNDSGTNRVLHHTIGSSESFAQEMEAFRPFVCKATRIFVLEDAHWQLDDAIAEALRQSKPGERSLYLFCERERKKNGRKKELNLNKNFFLKKIQFTSTSPATSPGSPTRPSSASRSPSCSRTDTPTRNRSRTPWRPRSSS